MKKLWLLTAVAAVACLHSCKKDTKKEPVEDIQQNASVVTYPNYSNLKTGNYWIYQRFQIDGTGNETALPIIDSCYIEKDSVINGSTYYKYVSPRFGWFEDPTVSTPMGIEFLRDSLSYIINWGGQVKFSSQDFTTVFISGYMSSANDTTCRYVFKMEDKNVSITTPSGTYITSSFNENYYMYPGFDQGGTFRQRHLRYAENVGKITESGPVYAGLPTQWERRLIRYHLN
ncbi:MAG: hypothetical protein HY062_10505 [Bacteroidetes bacterium]|nr:hypothetical protein [Bacteroidota bacterium]